ncbi:hypothetical protein DL96DRAFT_1599823 [Flagelloscypha sp. PMI_526]|nr:hypothetical protein DL96DRAFT_1599823 [Flagelloscypha sp. PMI_526]
MSITSSTGSTRLTLTFMAVAVPKAFSCYAHVWTYGSSKEWATTFLTFTQEGRLEFRDSAEQQGAADGEKPTRVVLLSVITLVGRARIPDMPFPWTIVLATNSHWNTLQDRILVSFQFRTNLSDALNMLVYYGSFRAVPVAPVEIMDGNPQISGSTLESNDIKLKKAISASDLDSIAETVSSEITLTSGNEQKSVTTSSLAEDDTTSMADTVRSDDTLVPNHHTDNSSSFFQLASIPAVPKRNPLLQTKVGYASKPRSFSSKSGHIQLWESSMTIVDKNMNLVRTICYNDMGYVGPHNSGEDLCLEMGFRDRSYLYFIPWPRYNTWDWITAIKTAMDLSKFIASWSYYSKLQQPEPIINEASLQLGILRMRYPAPLAVYISRNGGSWNPCYLRRIKLGFGLHDPSLQQNNNNGYSAITTSALNLIARVRTPTMPFPFTLQFESKSETIQISCESQTDLYTIHAHALSDAQFKTPILYRRYSNAGALWFKASGETKTQHLCKTMYNTLWSFKDSGKNSNLAKLRDDLNMHWGPHSWVGYREQGKLLSSWPLWKSAYVRPGRRGVRFMRVSLNQLLFLTISEKTRNQNTKQIDETIPWSEIDALVKETTNPDDNDRLHLRRKDGTVRLIVFNDPHEELYTWQAEFEAVRAQLENEVDNSSSSKDLDT